MKKEAEILSDNDDHSLDCKEGCKDFNIKNCTFVKLWLSDNEIIYGGLIDSSRNVSSAKINSSQEGDKWDEVEMNKIIEENRLLDKLNLLRQDEIEMPNLEEIPQIDDVTRRKILASGIQIVSQKPSPQRSEGQEGEISDGDLVSQEPEDDSIVLITPGQQIAALEIIAGNKLIHTIRLTVEVDDTASIESKELVESSMGFEYEEKSFLECVEIKKNIIQIIGKLKLENANLSMHAQKLRNREIKTKEYRNILESIERNKENIYNQTIELLKIEKRIQRLSAEDIMGDPEQTWQKKRHTHTKIEETPERTVFQKKERRKVIISAILEEAKKRKDAAKAEAEHDAVKEEAEKKVAEPEKHIEPNREPLPDDAKDEIRSIAKMMVWLQENDMTRASAETRKKRGTAAIEDLNKLFVKNKLEFYKVTEEIKKRFERKVYEKNARKPASQ